MPPLLCLPWDGNGISEAPKRIRTQKELAAINESTSTLALHYILMDDIELEYDEGASWTPMGKGGQPFTGSFNGNGKKISKLKVGGNPIEAGLFGYIKSDNIAVQNLHLVEVDVKDGFYAGAVAGILENGSIQGCSVTGMVSTITTEGNAGGIVGSSSGSSSQNCVALNSNVSGWASYTHRVVGRNNFSTTLQNNYGREGMNDVTWNDVALDGLNGQTSTLPHTARRTGGPPPPPGVLVLSGTLKTFGPGIPTPIYPN